MASVGENHVGTEQIVECEAEATVERAVTAAECQARHTDITGGAGGGGQAVGLGGGGDVTRGGAALNGGDLQPRTHDDPPHLGEVDDQAAVSQRPPGPVIATTPHRKRKTVPSGREHRGGHLSRGLRPRDQRRHPFHGTVPERTVVSGPVPDSIGGQSLE